MTDKIGINPQANIKNIIKKNINTNIIRHPPRNDKGLHIVTYSQSGLLFGSLFLLVLKNQVMLANHK